MATLFETAQKYSAEQLSASESLTEAMVNLNTTAYKGAKAMLEKSYGYYLNNIDQCYKGTQKLIAADDAASYFEVNNKNLAKGTDVLTDQTKSIWKMGESALSANYDAGRKIYETVQKAFPVDMYASFVKDMYKSTPPAMGKASTTRVPSTPLSSVKTPQASSPKSYTKTMLNKMLESDLVILATSMHIDVSVDDLKADTITKILAAQK